MKDNKNKVAVLPELQSLISPFFRELDKQFATFGGDPVKFKEAINHVLFAVSESAFILNEAVANIVNLRNRYEQHLKTLQDKLLIEKTQRGKDKINKEIEQVQGKLFNLLNFGSNSLTAFTSLIPDGLRDVVKLKQLLEEQKN